MIKNGTAELINSVGRFCLLLSSVELTAVGRV